MDWTDCPVVETVTGKVSGAPVIVNSRVRPQDLIAHQQEGPDWLAENFALPIDIVRTVLSFHERMMHRAAHPA